MLIFSSFLYNLVSKSNLRCIYNDHILGVFRFPATWFQTNVRLKGDFRDGKGVSNDMRQEVIFFYCCPLLLDCTVEIEQPKIQVDNALIYLSCINLVVMTMENVWICSLHSKKVKQFFHFVCFALDICDNWSYICRPDLFLRRGQICPIYAGLTCFFKGDKVVLFIILKD